MKPKIFIEYSSNGLAARVFVFIDFLFAEPKLLGVRDMNATTFISLLGRLQAAGVDCRVAKDVTLPKNYTLNKSRKNESRY